MKISSRELGRTLAARFPLRAQLGLLEVQVDAADLVLVPSRQRLGVTISARVTDSSTGLAYACEMDLVFAMRYEPADRTLRAYDIEISAWRMPGVPAETLETWKSVLTGLSGDAVDGVILHRFSRDELAFPDSLGLEPGKLTIEDQGIDVAFVPRGVTR